MTTLRTLVLLAQSLVILTIGVAGAAVIDSLFTESWHGMVVSISRAHRTTR
jgi:hypothetical protein